MIVAKCQKSEAIVRHKKHKMCCTVYPGWLQEQSEDKATAFFGGLRLGGAEQLGILLITCHQCTFRTSKQARKHLGFQLY